MGWTLQYELHLKSPMTPEQQSAVRERLKAINAELSAGSETLFLRPGDLRHFYRHAGNPPDDPAALLYSGRAKICFDTPWDYVTALKGLAALRAELFPEDRLRIQDDFHNTGWCNVDRATVPDIPRNDVMHRFVNARERFGTIVGDAAIGFLRILTGRSK